MYNENEKNANSQSSCCGSGNHKHGHGCGGGNHEHGHGCGGGNHEHGHGCGGDHDVQTITLTLDDNTSLKCVVIGIFMSGEQEYIALLPDGSDNVLLYQYNELDDNDIDLVNIEDDEEFQRVSQDFLELIGEEE